MPLAIDLSTLPAPVQRIVGPQAPTPMKLMAAGGVVPGLKPGDVLTVMALLTEDADEKVASKAGETLRKLPPAILNGALAGDLEPAVIDILADGYAAEADVVEKLLRMPRIGRVALETLADRATERIGEIVATNEQRLLEHPSVIEKLYMNKRVRMSTADRILELAVRNGLELKIPAFKEASQAIRNELIAEASEEPTFEDKIAKEAEEIAAKLEHAVAEIYVVDDEGEEHLVEKVVPLYKKINDMTVAQKIRLATLGNSAARALLIRDKNRLVATAAAQSPMMNENDAARIAASRQVSEDVLRIIANNREWTRSYQIKLNLVQNPRTPFAFTSRLITHLRDSELRTLSKSKNVPTTIQTAARQQLARKEKKA